MFKFKYIPEDQRSNQNPNQNKARSYANTMIKSEFDRYANNNVMNDYKKDFR